MLRFVVVMRTSPLNQMTARHNTDEYRHSKSSDSGEWCATARKEYSPIRDHSHTQGRLSDLQRTSTGHQHASNTSRHRET